MDRRHEQHGNPGGSAILGLGLVAEREPDVVLGRAESAAEVVPLTFVPYAEALRDQVDDLRRTVERKTRAAAPGGKAPLVFDGLPRLVDAVKAFQASRGLPADGIVGPMTWVAIVVQVKKGSQGDAVRGVQEEFQFRNLSGDPGKGLAVDGIFGPKTDAAVRGFQQALHQDIPSVTVDGIVGPVTWRALVSGMLSF